MYSCTLCLICRVWLSTFPFCSKQLQTISDNVLTLQSSIQLRHHAGLVLVCVAHFRKWVIVVELRFALPMRIWVQVWITQLQFWKLAAWNMTCSVFFCLMPGWGVQFSGLLLLPSPWREIHLNSVRREGEEFPYEQLISNYCLVTVSA